VLARSGRHFGVLCALAAVGEVEGRTQAAGAYG
jgi:hypothetical protein